MAQDCYTPNPNVVLMQILTALNTLTNKIVAGVYWILGANAVVTRLIATSTGAILAGAYEITIENQGIAMGTVNGVPLAVGEKIQLKAFTDESTKTFRKLPSITYDGTGTFLSITVLT
jgi:hypothetical protein